MFDAPGFFESGDKNLVHVSHVATFSGNLVLAAPHRLTEYFLRPYIVGGATLMLVRTTTSLSVFDVSTVRPAFDVGVGVVGVRDQQGRRQRRHPAVSEHRRRQRLGRSVLRRRAFVVLARDHGRGDSVLMVMIRRRSFCLLLLLLIAAVPLRSEETLRITPFLSGNRVVVSFELNDAYTEAVREAIASGLRTTFTYQLELRTPAWIDRTVGTTIVATTDQYDNLTRRHTLTRTVDGRVEDVLVTEDDAVVKIWLTKWTRVPVADTARLDPARDYYVRVTTRTRPLGGSFLGLTKTVIGQVKFTFVP